MNTAISNRAHWQELLRRAHGGNGHAQYEAGLYFETGHRTGRKEIVKEDRAQALEWFLKAYENGILEATIKVADYFYEGVHCGKDIGLAIEFYKKGSDSGSSIAARKLANIYRQNDDLEAAHELELRAKELEKI